MNLTVKAFSLVLAGFFVFGLFAYNSTIVESHHVMGNGASHHVCPLMGTTPGCVSALEHLAHWQSSFTASFVLTVFLVLCAALCLCLWSLLSHLLTFSTKRVAYVRPPPLFFLLPRHALAEAFSNGIIHPKLF